MTTQTINEKHGVENVVAVSLSYTRQSNRAFVTMMDPATGEITSKTVYPAGHFEDPVVDASPELIATYEARIAADRQRVADMKAAAKAETAAKAEAARVEAAKPKYGRVTGGKNAGRIGVIVARRESMYDAGYFYTLKRHGSTFHASEKLVVLIDRDEFDAIASGTVRFCQSCGVRIPEGQAMSGSLGTYCSDCYDAAEAAL